MNHPDHDGLCELNLIVCRMGGPPVRCTCGADERRAEYDFKRVELLLGFAKEDAEAARDLIERLRAAVVDARVGGMEDGLPGTVLQVERDADAWLAAHPKRTP